MEIKLTKGFFLEKDEWQYILRQRYTAVGRDGSRSENVKTISFHRTISQAVEKYISLLQTDLQTDKAVTLREYVKMVTQENKRAVKAIESLIEPCQ